MTTAAVEWTDVATAVGALISAAVLLAAFGGVCLQLRSMESAREAHLITDLSRRWDEEPLWGSRRAAMSFPDACKLCASLCSFREQNDEQYYVLLRVPNFFEDLGVLAEASAISAKLVAKSLRSSARFHWQLYRPWILAERQRLQTESFYAWFEYLVDELDRVTAVKLRGRTIHF